LAIIQQSYNNTMADKIVKLTKKELLVQNIYKSELRLIRTRAKKPVLVAMVGIVGSGKSSVARELAKHIGAVVVEGDKIRQLLRRVGECFDNVSMIAENLAAELLKSGHNVILDSDAAVNPKKRKRLLGMAKKSGVKVFFVRTVAEQDVMFGRMLSARYSPQSFFGGAKSFWSGKNKGVTVAIREMWRRTPHHYRWNSNNGGQWILKKFPFKIFVEIDTINEMLWKKMVGVVAKKILRIASAPKL